MGHLSYDTQLHGFVDSDCARRANDRRSASWICFSLRFSMISWASRKQNFLAHNTIEGECIASFDVSI
jgi:hypothetical protein